MTKVLTSKKLWVIGFVAIVISTTALVCFSSNGFLHLFKMKRELYELTKRNKSLTRENIVLLGKIRLFSSNRLVQEEVIRKELGWIKDGEIVIDFPRRISGLKDRFPEADKPN